MRLTFYEAHITVRFVSVQGVTFLKAPKAGNTNDAKKVFTKSLATALDYSLQETGA